MGMGMPTTTPPNGYHVCLPITQVLESEISRGGLSSLNFLHPRLKPGPHGDGHVVSVTNVNV